MKFINKLKWWIIYHLLSNKERSILLINFNKNQSGLEKYSNCLGETYQEYVEEVEKFKQNFKF